MGNRYREMEIRTATPLGLVVRFYDESIRMCRTAVESQQAGELARRGESVSKALALIGELRAALDFEVGGEMAQNLDSLYEFVCDRLMEASLRGETQPIQQAEGILVELRGAWAELHDQGVAAEARP